MFIVSICAFPIRRGDENSHATTADVAWDDGTKGITMIRVKRAVVHSESAKEKHGARQRHDDTFSQISLSTT